MAVYVHFSHFLDQTINSQRNPYNLASSRLLWVWWPSGYSTHAKVPQVSLSYPEFTLKYVAVFVQAFHIVSG